MAYLVSGATGFIGRRLVERLLSQHPGVSIHVLTRPASLPQLERLIERWGEVDPTASDRIRPLLGDLTEPRLGVDEETVAALRRDDIEHFFHLAAVYDMNADLETDHRVNVEGTRHAVELATVVDAGCLHHMSSIAVAGDYHGVFTEEMLDVGQPLRHPYHLTKFEAEQIVRRGSITPWRIYRPAIVVGDSRTGAIDKADGPYYFFPLIKRSGERLPGWVPLVGPELGHTNVVPVDFVVAAIDHIAHRPGLDGQTFHLANPTRQRVVDLVNALAQAAHAPRVAAQINGGPLTAVPRAALSLLAQVPAARAVGRLVLAEVGIPEQVVSYMDLHAEFDTRNATEALEGSEIAAPALESYADALWHYWERNLDPDRFRTSSFHDAIGGKVVMITGGSSGIGRATALKVAAAGGIPILIARGLERLEETRREIEQADGVAHVYSADLSDPDSVDALCERVLAEHPVIDILVNNAGRSIRRSIALSYERFHDFERTIQLNYLGTIKLIMALLPQMRERRSGHIINISSIGVQTNPPRFSAYVASKSALDAWTRVVASECIGDNVHFTTIHMPLVRTPMIVPTKLYDRFPTISPDQAADIICESIRTRPKQVGTRLGTLGEVGYALFPKLVDQVLAAAYRVFPDSAAASGVSDPSEHASREQVALARLTKGVHW